MTAARPPAGLGVLMVTGAYYPELSGGGLQARGVVHALKDRVDFMVLTTSIHPELPARSSDDGVPVYRIFVHIGRRTSEVLAAVKTIAFFMRGRHRFQIVNVHGFSRKSVLLHRLTRLLGKRFVLTLQTGGHDEPAAARALGHAAFAAYAGADLVISVSPALARAYVDGGLPEAKVRVVANAVDTDRFRPPLPDERVAIRRELGLPLDTPIVLFVGYFSADKRPDVLYEAWSRIDAPVSTLVFVGATESRYKEVDPAIAEQIRRKVEANGQRQAVRFVAPTLAIEKYYRAADVYVLPSQREGLPIALLEAMSSGLACVATRLPGSTDSIIEDGTSGRLVDADDPNGYSDAIAALLRDRHLALRLGAAARARALARYSIRHTAEQWLAAYREVVGDAQH
jgi:glycosyltransferase involved in cell wall biosynthesis